MGMTLPALVFWGTFTAFVLDAMFPATLAVESVRIWRPPVPSGFSWQRFPKSRGRKRSRARPSSRLKRPS